MNHGESISEILDFFDKSIAPQWNKKSLKLDSRILKSLEKIQASRRDFDARLFFIVVFGPLKSGKSTLVNTFARQYVSPTQFARESTRRASIVIKGPRSGIQQYFWKEETPDASDEHRREAFEKVIQFLRGVLTAESLDQTISLVELPYDKHTVDRVLAGPLEREPLITVIRCPGGSLIDEEVAILDVPGLDGFQTNTENNPAAFWIIDKSDLLIFTQSSFAPLNNQTSKFLRDLYEGSRKPPVLLVQNKIEARHWADPIEQQRETEEQVSVARQEVSNLLSVAAQDLPAWPINLGKAHDGFFKELPELFNDSRFETFEKDLQKYLETSRLELHEKNCLNEWLGQVIRTEKVLESILHELDTSLKDQQVKLALLRQARENIQNLSYHTKWIDHDLAELKTNELNKMSDRAHDLIRSRCHEISESVSKEFSKNAINGKVVNQLLYEHSQNLSNQLRKEIYVAHEAMCNAVESIYEAGATNLESSILHETKSTLKSLELADLPKENRFPRDKFPPFPDKELDFEAFQEKIKLLGFIPWPKKYPKNAIVESIKNDLLHQWNKSLDELIKAWMQRFRETFQELAIENRQQIWITHFENLIIQQTKALQEAKKEVADTNETLDEISTQVSATKNRLVAHQTQSNQLSPTFKWQSNPTSN